MDRIILQAMDSLAQEGRTFGTENSQKGEDEFQAALCLRLQELTGSSGWTWSRESRFKTKTLANESQIKVDIVGRHETASFVAIELKYVAIKIGADKPSNAPALPWDVAKDCLKLDLIRADLCEQLGGQAPAPDPDHLQTFTIALTNYADYWQTKKPWGGWASNFVDAMHTSPIHFKGIIRTAGLHSEKTIFRNKRCHIAMGRPWIGEWISYNNLFRYAFLQPAIEAKPDWGCLQKFDINSRAAIIPFLDSESREVWMQKHEFMKNASRHTATNESSRN